MTRYIDADNFRKTMIKRFGCIPCLTDYSEASRNDIPIDDALNLAPTADVVPKIEYDAVVSAVDNSTKEFLKLHDDYQKLLERNAKLHSQMAKYKLDLQNSKSEVEKWIDRCRDWHEVGELKCQEIVRLHGILLQFTDIVHKWGAKNNIDTSEISLVPILQEEADSIIKKANQELASEIFEKIEKIILDNTYPDFDREHKPVNIWKAKTGYDAFEELKKKYTEDTK